MLQRRNNGRDEAGVSQNRVGIAVPHLGAPEHQKKLQQPQSMGTCSPLRT